MLGGRGRAERFVRSCGARSLMMMDGSASITTQTIEPAARGGGAMRRRALSSPFAFQVDGVMESLALLQKSLADHYVHQVHAPTAARRALSLPFPRPEEALQSRALRARTLRRHTRALRRNNTLSRCCGARRRASRCVRGDLAVGWRYVRSFVVRPTAGHAAAREDRGLAGIARRAGEPGELGRRRRARLLLRASAGHRRGPNSELRVTKTRYESRTG